MEQILPYLLAFFGGVFGAAIGGQHHLFYLV